jgi:hypothetical protein
LFTAIAHGSDEHRAWLLGALRDYRDGKPVQRPVTAPPQTDAQEYMDAQTQIRNGCFLDPKWKPANDCEDLTVPEMIAHIYKKRPGLAVAPNGHTCPFLSVEEWTRIYEWSCEVTAPPGASALERKTLLAKSEQLWDDLQRNELGGYSGINRPFHIAEVFKEIAREARARGVIEGSTIERWTCFHCGETFVDRKAASLHFGRDEMAHAACQIDIAKYREMSELHERHLAEDSDADRRYYQQQSEHAVALRREEEKGYARGLADGRIEGSRVSEEERIAVARIAREQIREEAAEIVRLGVSTTDMIRKIRALPVIQVSEK